jgi:hypothetical protein
VVQRHFRRHYGDIVNRLRCERRRVLQLLNRLQEVADTPGSIWLPKRDQMGDMLDIAVETASRVIASLCREGVISLVPPQRAELDLARLRQALTEADR